MEPIRCWGETPSPMQDYHDTEWGEPERDEGKMFEFLTLGTAQAGLSWETILKRQEVYRRVFAGFDAEKVARFGSTDVERRRGGRSIIRNRSKIEAAIYNARLVVELREAGGGLSGFLWDFVDGVPLQPRLREEDPWPATSPLSERITREMKRLGFQVLRPHQLLRPPTAAGLTNDHKIQCFRHAEVARMGGEG